MIRSKASFQRLSVIVQVSATGVRTGEAAGNCGGAQERAACVHPRWSDAGDVIRPN